PRTRPCITVRET
nr:immunoglobulin heavy chain junction region [Homo sapiens]